MVSHPLCLVKFTHSTGNNLGNVHFLWRVSSETDSSNLIEENYQVINQVKSNINVYHSRAMRNAFKAICGQVSNMKPAFARELYRKFVGDASAPETHSEALVDKRVQAFLDCEDDEIIWDLRHNNAGRREKYTVFFENCEKYINSQAEVAVDERRHDSIVHMATSMSAPVLLREVTSMCPPDTPVPSVKWLLLQFWPKDPTKKSSMQYTGRLKVKYMVQARQFRANHPDAHYASALFRNQRAFSIQFSSFSKYVFLDDKHHCKIGEPGLPVAAIDRGKRVIVSLDKKFAVADHDHTKCSIIPSVILSCTIPNSLDDSFYRGRVYVGIKDAVFEPSSPLRHATELHSVLKSQDEISKPILLIYSDGGPDHNLTFLATQISYICLFLNMDLDFLSAVRTPPYHSWKNPVERIMSIINVALESVGLMRQTMGEDFEKLISNANSMKDIREVATANASLKSALLESLEPVKCLISGLIVKLKLKDDNFSGEFTLLYACYCTCSYRQCIIIYHSLCTCIRREYAISLYWFYVYSVHIC